MVMKMPQWPRQRLRHAPPVSAQAWVGLRRPSASNRAPPPLQCQAWVVLQQMGKWVVLTIHYHCSVTQALCTKRMARPTTVHH